MITEILTTNIPLLKILGAFSFWIITSSALSAKNCEFWSFINVKLLDKAVYFLPIYILSQFFK